MDTQNDAAFVTAARARDKTAFGVLVERYTPMIQRVIWHRVYDRELTRDLAQETFLQAYLSLEDLRDPARFRSWLYGIALNVCRMYLRRRTPVTLSWEELQGGVYLPDAVSPEEIAERLELRRTIAGAINRLSPAHREAVSLFYYEDFSLTDAAGILGISVNAMKARLHRARLQLRTLLEFNETVVSEQGEIHMLPVKVVDIVMKEALVDIPQARPSYRVVLLHEESRRALVIWIGETEAMVIGMKLNNHDTPRPMTQALIARLLAASDAQVESVDVRELKDETFYATVHLKTTSGEKEIDARPSDAIALALYAGSPVDVSEEVMAKAGIDVPEGKVPVGGGLKEIAALSAAASQQYQAYLDRLAQKSAEEKAVETQADNENLLARVFG